MVSVVNRKGTNTRRGSHSTGVLLTGESTQFSQSCHVVYWPNMELLFASKCLLIHKGHIVYWLDPSVVNMKAWYGLWKYQYSSPSVACRVSVCLFWKIKSLYGILSKKKQTNSVSITPKNQKSLHNSKFNVGLSFSIFSVCHNGTRSPFGLFRSCITLHQSRLADKHDVCSQEEGHPAHITTRDNTTPAVSHLFFLPEATSQ